MRKCLIGIGCMIVAASAMAQTSTQINSPQYYGKTGIPDAYAAIDANFALMGLPGTAGSVSNATAVESGSGDLHKTVLTFTDLSLVVADGGFTNAPAPKIIYTFPAGMIKLEGGYADIVSIVTTNFNETANDIFYMSVGHAGPTAGDGTLTGTSVSLIPSTTIDTVDATTMTNDFNAGSSTSTFIDGTTTPAALSINMGVPTASDLGANTNLLNGTLTFFWTKLN